MAAGVAAATNVFVLTTGRSGSLTFAEACRRITNYSSGHETRVGLIGAERLEPTGRPAPPGPAPVRIEIA